MDSPFARSSVYKFIRFPTYASASLAFLFSSNVQAGPIFLWSRLGQRPSPTASSFLSHRQTERKCRRQTKRWESAVSLGVPGGNLIGSSIFPFLFPMPLFFLFFFGKEKKGQGKRERKNRFVSRCDFPGRPLPIYFCHLTFSFPFRFFFSKEKEKKGRKESQMAEIILGDRPVLRFALIFPSAFLCFLFSF